MVANAMNGWQSLTLDSRRMRRWLLFSLLLHLPLTPLGPLIGLVALLSRPGTASEPIEQLEGIPVELLQEQAAAPPIAPEPAAPEPASAEPAAIVKPEPTPKKRKVVEQHDAGVEQQDAGVPLEDAPPLDAGPPEQRPIAANETEPDAGSLLAAADAGTPLGEAVAAASSSARPEDALASSTRGIADSNANVRLSLFMNKVRTHPLGNDLGQLLKSVYQWRDFFTPAALDPVKDFERIFLFGPQLRDSSQVAAFLEHNMRPARIRRAIDGLVTSSGPGSAWIKGSKNPAARAVADRAQRLFVLYPNRVVAVVPPGAEKDALALPEFKLPMAIGDELARAFVKTPARALLGTRFQLSRSIRTADIRVYAESDGGARIEGALEDDSSESAQRNARQIKRDVDTITLANNWLLSGSRMAEPLSVKTEDNHIHVTLHVTRAQAERILRIAQAYLTPEGRDRARRSVDSADANRWDAGQPLPRSLPIRPPDPDALR